MARDWSWWRPILSPILEPDPEAEERPLPIVVTRLQFKTDGAGFLYELRDHLYLFDLSSRTSVQLTRGPYDDDSPAFSPDGRQIAFSSNRSSDPDANYNSDIFVVAARFGAEPRRISSAPSSDSAPVWSPDGRTLAWVEGGDPADSYFGVSHLAVAPAAGGAPRRLAAELDRNVYAPLFSRNGDEIFFYYEDRGNQPLGAVALAGGPVRTVVSGERHVVEFDARQGALAILDSEPHRPAEISFVREGDDARVLRRLTHSNDELLSGIELGPVERFTVASQENSSIEGFFTFPPASGTEAVTAGRGKRRIASRERLPALLRIHGGPVDQFSTQWSFERQVLAAHGYLVIAANPRGSAGRGREFARAIWADWGNRDYIDVMAAVDHAVRLGIADADRLGVYGWSYGGILTNHVITKTHRFKAAISGASEVNYLANYGHDEYQREWEAELGLPWREAERWVRLSPFFRVENITTPTLLVCGQDDWNVPLINSEQLYQALRRLGKTTELVVYPGEAHIFSRPSFIEDRLRRYLRWFDRYVLAKAEPAEELASVAKTDPPVAEPSPSEATSLLGAPLPAPVISDAARESLEEDLKEALLDFAIDPDSVDAAIWVGRRLGYLGRYREAIAAFTRALDRHPGPADEVRLRRHRGHRYITVRDLPAAIADLETAARLIREHALPDAIEPDGAPNDLGIPTSTTHFNVYYHLGLAHYLRGDFEAALAAYRLCLGTAPGSNDRVVATTDWLWLTFMRLGRRDEAAAALAAVAGDLEVIEDQTYLDRIRLYKGEIKPEELLTRRGSPVEVATTLYGVGAWYLIQGDRDKAQAIFERVTATPQWGAFAVVAAEAELARTTPAP